MGPSSGPDCPANALYPVRRGGGNGVPFAATPPFRLNCERTAIMFDSIGTELRELGGFFVRRRRTGGVIGLACLFLLLHQYRPIGPEWANALVYYAGGPLLAGLVLFGGRLQ